jgi:serine/threonine-protein kinase
LELLSGAPLHAAVGKGPEVTVARASELIYQALCGLTAIHGAGLMHRDLCPDNLFVSESHLRILDFGLSRRYGADASLTPGGVSMGQVPYISPEQLFNARQVDPRTDLFSLGVVAYELLAGVLPFDGQTPGERLSRLSQGAAEPLHEVRPDVPLALSAWIHALLQPERTKRPANSQAALTSWPGPPQPG